LITSLIHVITDNQQLAHYWKTITATECASQFKDNSSVTEHDKCVLRILCYFQYHSVFGYR